MDARPWRKLGGGKPEVSVTSVGQNMGANYEDDGCLSMETAPTGQNSMQRGFFSLGHRSQEDDTFV